jgi:hypothetical protein
VRRIVYASRAVHEFEDFELLELLDRARAQNQRRGVTGMLVYSARSFLQLFEGEDDAVEVIWDRIRMDERHTDLRVLGDGAVTLRQFGNWSMGFEHPDAEQLEQTIPGYRASIDYPFVSSQLIDGAETAETLLTLYSRRSL